MNPASYLIFFMLGHKREHISSLWEEIKKNSLEYVWRKFRPICKPFLAEEIFTVFHKSLIDWTEKSFKAALFVSQIGLETSDKTKLSNFFKSIILSEEINDLPSI